MWRFCGRCQAETEHRLYTSGDSAIAPHCLTCYRERQRRYRKDVRDGVRVPVSQDRDRSSIVDLRVGERVCTTCFMTSCDCG